MNKEKGMASPTNRQNGSSTEGKQPFPRRMGYTRIEASRAGRLAYAKARVIRSVAAQLRYALRYALPTN